MGYPIARIVCGVSVEVDFQHQFTNSEGAQSVIVDKSNYKKELVDTGYYTEAQLGS